MRKLLLNIVLIQTIFMVGCVQENNDIVDIKKDDIITMENLDNYMFRDDVQYVDLRNFEAGFLNGFIYSFEIIPFFDYLDYRAFNRNDSYEFDPDQIINEDIIYNLFDKDKTIFLYADGCIRSGYIKEVLTYLEYGNVFVLGGFFDYDGIHKVLGDGSYDFGESFYNSYYDEENEITYYIYGKFELSKKIVDIRFDLVSGENYSLRNAAFEDTVVLNDELTKLEEYIVYDLVTITELHYSLSNLEVSGYSSEFELDQDIVNNLIKVIEDLLPTK